MPLPVVVAGFLEGIRDILDLVAEGVVVGEQMSSPVLFLRSSGGVLEFSLEYFLA